MRNRCMISSSPVDFHVGAYMQNMVIEAFLQSFPIFGFKLVLVSILIIFQVRSCNNDAPNKQEEEHIYSIIMQLLSKDFFSLCCLFFSSPNLIIYSVNVANPRLMNKILATTKPHPSSESPYFRKEYLFCSQITIWCTKLTSCIISRMPKGNSTIPFLNISRACMLYFELDSLKSIHANI